MRNLISGLENAVCKTGREFKIAISAGATLLVLTGCDTTGNFKPGAFEALSGITLAGLGAQQGNSGAMIAGQGLTQYGSAVAGKSEVNVNYSKQPLENANYSQQKNIAGNQAEERARAQAMAKAQAEAIAIEDRVRAQAEEKALAEAMILARKQEEEKVKLIENGGRIYRSSQFGSVYIFACENYTALRDQFPPIRIYGQGKRFPNDIKFASVLFSAKSPASLRATLLSGSGRVIDSSPNVKREQNGAKIEFGPGEKELPPGAYIVQFFGRKPGLFTKEDCIGDIEFEIYRK